MKATPENIKKFKLRKFSDTIKSYLFKTEIVPGKNKFYTIELNARYKINNPNNRGVNNKIVEVVSFAYEYFEGNNPAELPIGVLVKYLSNNSKGTYYELSHLEKI